MALVISLPTNQAVCSLTIQQNLFKWKTLSTFSLILLFSLIFHSYFEYIIRKKKEDKTDASYGYLIHDYPKELAKKLNLL